VWLGQRFDVDALTPAAVIANAVPGLGVGTAVVPINPRHPLVVASAAQTVQATAHGNFSLGIGLGGNELERRAFGLSAGKGWTAAARRAAHPGRTPRPRCPSPRRS
jgi:alkanesulfonate monooxygenase SsuD/methylene tetrahydromethanopterin reductase-like flavin-dependent oxidoreductase (luciferase family)